MKQLRVFRSLRFPQAHATARYTFETPPPPPPSTLTEEQAGFWREIVTDLAPGHIRSDNAPLLVELCRHMAYARQLAEQLAEMRKRALVTATAHTQKQRPIYSQTLQMAREESRLIAVLSVKLRLANQTRDDSVAAKRAREATPIGPRPWELGTDKAPWEDDADEAPTN